MAGFGCGSDTTFFEKLGRNLFPTIYAFGERLGLTLIYEYCGIACFADENDKELPVKLDKIDVLIRQLFAEKHSTGQDCMTAQRTRPKAGCGSSFAIF